MPGTTPRQLAVPTPAGVAVLALAAIALLATSAPLPTLHSQVVGEATLSPGETVERELRIHLDPEAGPPSLARVSVGFESSVGLSRSYTDQATAELTEAHDAFGSFPADEDASARCAEGCDLVYRIDLRAGPDVLPASVARYTADVEFQFRSGPYPDAAWLTTELDGAASGPPSPLWAFLAGLVALVAGIAAGPAVARQLGPAWPRRSTIALIVLLLAPLVWLYVTRLVSVLAQWDQLRLGSPLYVLFLVDPWSIALLGTLAWGLWRGSRRRDLDGGWLLGLAAVATVGLGGLWLGDLVGEAAIVQPLVAALAFALLGGLGGLIIGEAWRTDERAWHDRGWAAAAVLSHGVVIAGFGFLAMNAMYDGSGNGSAFLLLVPLVVVAVLFRRWFRGGRAGLILVDLIIAGLGVLGAFVTGFGTISVAGTSSPFELENLGVMIATVASIVALVTACYPMRRPDGRPPTAPSPVAASA